MAAYLLRADVRIVRSDNYADTTMSKKGAATGPPPSPSAGVHNRTEMQQGEGVRDVTVGTGDLMSRARAGSGAAFRALTEPSRRALDRAAGHTNALAIEDRPHLADAEHASCRRAPARWRP